jgi:glycosyltransferase involved in cell wall biosynthesis
MARVSVVIPNYNRSHFILETIRNMQAQTLAPYEIIVVDDGSTDNSLELLESLGSQIVLISQKNKGPGAARNAGFQSSSGDLIVFMDSDDISSLNKLESQSIKLEAEGADIAFGPWLQIKWGSSLGTEIYSLLQSRHPGPELSLLEWHLKGWTPVLQNCLFRKSFLESIGPLKSDLLVAEDWEFFNRIFLANPKSVFTPECITFYRLNGQDKLSGDGVSDEKKSHELAKASRYIQQNIANTNIRISDDVMRSFRFTLWNIQRKSKEEVFIAPCSHPEILYFRKMQVVSKIKSRVRRLLYGNSWPSFYHCSEVKASYLKLLADTTIPYPI